MKITSSWTHPYRYSKYDKRSNSINIDTGAYASKCLTGLKLTPTGEIMKFVSVETDSRDT